MNLSLVPDGNVQDQVLDAELRAAVFGLNDIDVVLTSPTPFVRPVAADLYVPPGEDMRFPRLDLGVALKAPAYVESMIATAILLDRERPSVGVMHAVTKVMNFDLQHAAEHAVGSFASGTIRIRRDMGHPIAISVGEALSLPIYWHEGSGAVQAQYAAVSRSALRLRRLSSWSLLPASSASAQRENVAKSFSVNASGASVANRSPPRSEGGHLLRSHRRPLIVSSIGTWRS